MSVLFVDHFFLKNKKNSVPKRSRYVHRDRQNAANPMEATRAPRSIKFYIYEKITNHGKSAKTKENNVNSNIFMALDKQIDRQPGRQTSREADTKHYNYWLGFLLG